MPILKLSAFGQVEGAKQVKYSQAAAGSRILTIDLASEGAQPFTADDVGKDIVIATIGANADKLITKIAAFVSESQVTLDDPAITTTTTVGDGTGAGATWGYDCSAALNDAFAQLRSTRGGAIEIDGSFMLTQPVALDMVEPVELLGFGGSARLYIAVPADQTALTFTNCARLTIRGVNFIGTTKEWNDAYRTLRFGSCKVLMENNSFYGLSSISAAGGSIVRAERTNLHSRDNLFGGCTAAKARENPVLDVQSFVGFISENDTFYDYGTISGIYYSKIWQAVAHSWINVGDQFQDAPNANGQGSVRIINPRFDEGAYSGLVVWPVEGRISRMVVDGIQQNVCAATGAIGNYFRRVDRLDISRTAHGWVGSGLHPAVVIEDCGVVEIDKVVATEHAQALTASNLVSLTVAESPTLVTRNLTNVAHYVSIEGGVIQP